MKITLHTLRASLKSRAFADQMIRSARDGTNDLLLLWFTVRSSWLRNSCSTIKLIITERVG